MRGRFGEARFSSWLLVQRLLAKLNVLRRLLTAHIGRLSHILAPRVGPFPITLHIPFHAASRRTQVEARPRG